MGSTTDRNKALQKLLRAAPWVGFIVLIGGAVIMAVRLGIGATILWFAFAALVGALLLFWEALRSVLDPDAVGAEGDQAAIVASEIGDLEHRKKTALKALRDLEFEHSIGRLSDEDHKTLREKYRAEAREAMGAIDRALGTYLGEAQELVAKVVRDVTKKAEEEKARRATPSESAAAEDDEGDESAEDESAEEGESEEESDQAESEETAASDAAERSEKAATEAPASSKAVETRPEPSAAAETSGAMAVVSAGEKPAVSAHRVCPSCATQNDADAVFCKKCAARLEEAAS